MHVIVAEASQIVYEAILVVDILPFSASVVASVYGNGAIWIIDAYFDQEDLYASNVPQGT